MARVNGGFHLAVLALAALILQDSRGHETWSVVPTAPSGGKLDILLRGDRIATYSYQDAAIPRPFFCNLVPPDGPQVTRHHPPRPDDRQDHADLHPGLWLAFGDLDGNDNWRLRARVQHQRFVEMPRSETSGLSFTVQNNYWDNDGSKLVCHELARYRFQEIPQGVLLCWDSTLCSDDQDFYFGDQEEMGLGVRLATPIAVATGTGGRIRDAAGRMDERQIWGTTSAWCHYAGQVDDQVAGVLLIPDPENFRPCWYHARDYGFIAANPFGRRAFTKGQVSKVVVRRGESFRLRYGVVIHSSQPDNKFDPRDAYQRYLSAK